MTKGIKNHEGRKYLRTIHSATNGQSVQVDVYAVLVAFNVTCPARAHAIKKLLCAGERGKQTVLADLVGADAAVNRAIELEAGRVGDEKKDTAGGGVYNINGGVIASGNLPNMTVPPARVDAALPRECTDPKEYG